jgi:hypothetical protein
MYVFWNHGDHDVGSATLLSDLEERMFVSEAFFACFAIVKVSADAALVTDSLDGHSIASVTGDTGV